MYYCMLLSDTGQNTHPSQFDQLNWRWSISNIAWKGLTYQLIGGLAIKWWVLGTDSPPAWPTAALYGGGMWD